MKLKTDSRPQGKPCHQQSERMLITCRRNKSLDEKIMHLRLFIPLTQYSQPSHEIPQLVVFEVAVVAAEAAELPPWAPD